MIVRDKRLQRRPTIFFNNKLCDAAATDKMWTARLFSRWPCRLERSTVLFLILYIFKEAIELFFYGRPME